MDSLDCRAAPLRSSCARAFDWPALLAAYIEQHRATPFAWGAHDCVGFAIGWLAVVRPDLAPREELSGRLDYVDAAGAARQLHEISLRAVVDGWGQLVGIAPAQAGRGDLVLVDIDGRASLAVNVAELACGPGPAGLVFVPMTAAIAAWRV